MQAVSRGLSPTDISHLSSLSLGWIGTDVKIELPREEIDKIAASEEMRSHRQMIAILDEQIETDYGGLRLLRSEARTSEVAKAILHYRDKTRKSANRLLTSLIERRYRHYREERSQDLCSGQALL